MKKQIIPTKSIFFPTITIMQKDDALLSNKVRYFKKITVFSILFIISFSGYSQKEFYNWYFGQNAGLSFHTNPPTALTNGAINTTDQTSVISDAQGNLIMYSDGMRVMNKNHTQMPNGNALITNFSHSSLIIKQPGNSNFYYIFTLTYFGYPAGLQYAIADISLDGGLGAVVSKNNTLIAPVCEKLTAVHHANGQDIWIITHKWQTNEFYAFLLSPSGISAPIITSIGPIHSGGSMSGYNAQGQLAASPDGSKIALATYEMGFFGVYNFNRSNGIVSNEIQIPGYLGSWGVQFSPDGTKLYATRWTFSQIYQFDLTAGTATDIANSAVVVGTATSPTPGYTAGFLQLGPDNKIYVAKMGSNYVGVINSPDASGVACNFVDNAIHLSGKICQSGLPNYIATTAPPPIDFSFLPFCYGDSVQITSTNLNNANSYIWNFGDPASGTANTSLEVHPSHLYSSTGNYTVSLITTNGAIIDTIQHTITIYPPFDLNVGPDTTLCTSPLNITAGPGAASYLWSTGQASENILVNISGNYSVLVQDSNGCMAFDTVNVNFSQFPQINLGPDKFLCNVSFLLLEAGSSTDPNLTYQWQDGSSGPSYTVGSAGEYFVSLSNLCGVASDTINIKACPDCIIDLPSAFSPNGDGINDNFRVLGAGFDNMTFIIYDRHGRKVFETSNPSEGWDGTFEGVLQENEVYFYYLSATCINDERLVKQGDLQLVL